jgi:hypothetical protein
MNRLSYFLIGLLFVILVSCGDDEGNNPTSAYKVEMTITGDQSLEYLSNNATFTTPNDDSPHYRIASNYTENGRTHTLSMTIDNTWFDKKEIDLTRDTNRFTFAYDKGIATYTVIEGTFSATTLSQTTVIGTLNFTAQKIGEISKTIKVEVGKIHITNK